MGEGPKPFHPTSPQPPNETERTTMKTKGKFQVPEVETETDRQWAEYKATQKKLFPHSDMEATYQNSSVYWILLGGDNTPFRDSEFFEGFKPGTDGVLTPKFAKQEDGVMRAVAYFTREAAHAGMSELLKFYEVHGERLNIKKPRGLTIAS
jgi:hypothetical protein